MKVRNPVRLISLGFALLALPGIAACQQATDVDEKAQAPATETNNAAPVNFERETKSFAFSYAYPAEAAALPGLAKMLEGDREKALAELKQQTAEAQKDAADNDYPFNPHMLGISWKVTGESTELLAMVGEISSFSGGAHGNTGYEALIWDKTTNRRIALDAVFTDMAAALAAIRQPYCDALNADRAERRGEYAGAPDDMFNACPPFSDLVLVPFASGDGGFDRIMIIAAPYVAGPYVEGAYEISVALPEASIERIKPEYRTAFTATAR